ncbi:conserved hypothetical protein [Crenothrix polyspora]|uniref:Addiction module killer protein n=1 Tax=Crenothrix polyspora TaxID=360316 RepID=A0A1R4H6Z3_9GAMM|nr:type II toxin-antitoxin system RelE/ParE family toxin [Crenothrix polyspora]SJM92045.1 conserved hypothetical protein [Crenothrix polyspora]
MNIILTTETFDNWFEQLRDNQAKARIKAKLRRASEGNLGDIKPVGEGVSEIRIHYGSGYRLYFMYKGLKVIILLAGGDKATQDRDIKAALSIAQKIKGG